MTERGSYLDWTDAWERKLWELRNPAGQEGSYLRAGGGMSFEQVARRMNAWFCTDVFTKDNCQKRYRLLESSLDIPSLREFPAAVPTPYYSKYFDEYGRLKDPPSPKLRLNLYLAELERSGRWYKTLVLSDQQGAFADDDLIQKVTNEHPAVDLVVIPGDVVDWFEASRYTKERDIPLAYEMDWLVRHYEFLSQRYPGVPIVVTDSNHRRRVATAVRSLPSGLLPLVESNPERYLAQPFPQVHALDSWWFQHGDAIYSHAEGPTTHAGDNSRAAIDAFILKLLDARQGVQQFRVVVTGHSHKVSSLMHKTILGLEPGTLARLPLPYSTAADQLKTIQENGFAVVVQKGGRSDLGESRSFVLGRD